MQCPYCHYGETKVTDSRDTGIYTIRRRRECLRCHRRFTTYEHIELTPIYVIKKDGRREKYDKNKIRIGVLKALEKRPVSREQIEEVLDRIEEKIHRLGREEIESSLIGEYVMDALRELDQVAYIRFASVYRAFADITLFEEEVRKLTKDIERGKK
ncbi:MAG: transcriptional regulator NrdR [Thermoplasmata archaeon]|nr:MAG: transcriptional regulator NrdR [Thermoplasmata archaeon]